MNGFEQIKSFYSWVFNNSDKVRPTHISLYLFLLNQNNRCMWVEWFKCPYDLAMQGACIGNKNTYYKALDELQLYGLIFYKKGINLHKAPMIKLVQLYDNVPLTGKVTVPLCEPLTVPVSEPLSVLLNKNTYKLITDNYKLVNNNIETWMNLEKPLILLNRSDDFALQCLQDQIWKEAICMKSLLTPITIEFALKDYNIHLIQQGEIKNDIKDYKSHFVNWVKKRKELKAKDVQHQNKDRL